MAGESVVYSNARVKAMENSLLTNEKLTRMCFAESLTDGVKILYESNYGGGVIADNANNYDVILRSETERVAAFLREAMPKDSGLDSFISQLDYHNAKVVLKAIAEDKEIDREAVAGGGFIDNIEEYIRNSPARLPENMAEGVNAVLTGIRYGDYSPQDIDIAIDKAFYKEITSKLKRVKCKSVRDYWVAEIDFANLLTFFRAKRTGKEDILKKSLIDGGEILPYNLLKLYDLSPDAVYEKLGYTRYSKVIAEGVSALKNKTSLTAFERARDNYLLNIFKEDRWNVFDSGAIAGFFLAKRYEIRNIRMILVCLKNGVNSADIQQRLRENYA